MGRAYHCRCGMISTYHHTKLQSSGCLGTNKKQALYIQVWTPWAHILQHIGHVYHCGCVDYQYLSPYSTRVKLLSYLLRKRGPVVFKYRPLGSTPFNLWVIFTIVDVCIIKIAKLLPWLLRLGGRQIQVGPLGVLDFPFGDQNCYRLHTSNMNYISRFEPWDYRGSVATREQTPLLIADI